MTVKELIAELEKYDGEAMVVTEYDGQYEEVDGTNEAEVIQPRGKVYYVPSWYKTDTVGGIIKAIAIG